MVGTLVPLRVQMLDGNKDVRIQAEIINPLNEKIDTIELEHIDNGLYYSNKYIMPDLAFILVRYITDDSDYSITMERIDSSPAPVIEKQYKIGHVRETLKISNLKIGYVWTL